MPSTIPVKPRLRSYLRTVQLTGQRLLLRGGRQQLVLKGASATELLPDLLPLLDGQHSVADIAAVLQHVDIAVLHEAIAFLQARDILEEAGDESGPGDPQSNFWLARSGSRNAMPARLAAARVRVLGSGQVFDRTLRELWRAGVGEITSATPPEPLLADAALALVCTDTPAYALWEAVNAAALESGTPWLRAVLNDTLGDVGPFVVPHASACYVCVALRERSNSRLGFEADDFAQNALAANAAEPIALPSAATAVAAMAVLETVRYFTGYAPVASRNAVLSLHVLTSEVRRHDVLKLPRCPACSRAAQRPLPQIWDLVPVAEKAQ
ncbi:MAG: hypothetical protein QOI11_1846 [Candidatus Eremiobacteraeota bacterium]|nr:hypothetical protein [Candidatus Eremiobacteraeota bacterium]